jgi:hypothetical protein
MAQKTDLNISPYYDDFDKDKNFYKVLFKPGFPVQARELTTLQSILQNQVESFGSNIFKEGSMVIPGGITFDNDYSAVKLNSTNLGVDVSLYIKNFIGKTITGQSSGVTASVKNVVFTSESDLVEYLTIYVKYSAAGNDSETSVFEDGELLIANENVKYGNTTISSGTAFASLIASDATSTGSALSVDNGVYFVRGTFVDVPKQTLILDYYTNTPSYRVGFNIKEETINAKDDDSLYDNAKGFTNFAAPGADRFKISLNLIKKSLTDFNDTDFIEIFRSDDGKIKKIVDKTVYNIIRDYIAERTFDESGHYTVDEFELKVLNSLNDRIDNDGLFLENETTEEGNIPSDDLMCFDVSPGKAYVAGYDVEIDGTSTVDVEKPRDTENVSSINVPFEMGHLLRVNNVAGAPKENDIVTLKTQFKADTSGQKVIGQARVYTFNLTDAAYSNQETQWDLYLYDIQTYTSLTFNRNVSAAEIPQTSFIQGKSSGASGFAVAAGANSAELNIYQTSGTFVADEQITINGVDASLALKSFDVYGIRDIKSVAQNAAGFPGFAADTVLSRRQIEGITQANFVSSTGVFSSPGKLFTGIKEGDVIRYQDGTNLRYNRVSDVGGNLTTITVTNIASVSNVFDGGKGADGTYNIELAVPELRNNENASLFASLPDSNISSVNLSGSQLSVTRQITGLNISGNSVTFNLSNITGITSASFETFDQERYSVHYSGGGIGTITSDSFTLNGNDVTITGLNNGSNAVVNATLKKNGIQSKIKEYTRSALSIVNLSTLVQSGAATSDSINDGLTYNSYYGLRVQDDQISLNVPDVAKVLSVYESTNTADPILDRIEFSSISQVDTDAIIGEDIIGSDSGALARIVQNSSSSATPSIPSNNLGIVYLNDQTFSVGEVVTFKESGIISNVIQITFGKYKNITNNFTLDKGQRNEYYDYSRLVRVGTQIPERRLLIVYDHYTVPASDNGDVFTVLSYDANRFSEDIPAIGPRQVRSSDTLDFRPRVGTFSVTTSSPFDFTSRTSNFGTEPKFNLKPGEGSVVGYDFYLPRIDRVYIDKFGTVITRRGVSSIEPVPPVNEDPSLMQLAEVRLPAYLYNTDDAEVSMIDNRRYTMRDIGNLEDRVENLERFTSLSLLELSTESLRIEDSEGNNRFKSGIFVDSFNDNTLSDNNLTTTNSNNGELRPTAFRNTLQQKLVAAVEQPLSLFDSEENYDLLDPNVQKTGNAVTLKYDSVDWLNQSFATRVENVNPFHVIEYNGIVRLNPDKDNWTRTIRLAPRIVERTIRRNLGVTRTITNTTSTGGNTTRIERTARRATSTNVNTVLVSSGDEKYIRSRNVSFFGTLFRPLARHYQFLDNHSNLDFIPKLIEIANSNTLDNYGSSNGAFQKGETVRVYNDGKRIGTFRLAQSNHKKGKFNSPKFTYTTNPYVTSESIPSGYSQSSKTINIDLNALASEAQGSFSGYVEKGAKIVGQTSGAIAYVKDLRLISDINGTLFGSFFIKNPHVNPAPNPRILTGKKTFRLSSSSTNQTPLPGSTLVSAGDATYTARGTFRELQRVTTITTTITTSATRINTRRVDPLAQTFTVGRDIEAPDFSGDNDDDNGVFLTEVDLFFASKPSGNEPVTVEIRSVELGTPTLIRIAEGKTLSPSEINTSTDGKTATRVVFDQPIFLPPGQEYALVLLAPNSDQYEVWTAKMGEKTIETKDLPNSQAIKYSRQFAMGSLFKSQNGSTWTPAQKSDLKFKLYKAKFTANTGIVHFGNPPLDSSNGYIPTLQENAITALPKNVTLGITTITSSDPLVNILTAGRRIAGAGNSFGTIVSVGSSAASVGITTGGLNYTNRTNSATTNVFGSGSGLTVDITQTGGIITGITVNNPGTGYATGDVVSIVNGSSQTGRDAVITVTASGDVDTLYLTNVQGSIPTGDLIYYDTDTTTVSLGNTDVLTSTEDGGIFSGNYLQVEHFNHGMYANNNKLVLNDIISDTAPTTLTEQLSATTGGSGTIQVEDSSIFETFEGQGVNSVNIGYVKIGDEVIGYSTATSNQLTIDTRGVEGVVETHEIGDQIMKYEFNGISLRRINGIVYDISDTGIESDSYFIEVDRSATSTIEGKAIGLNRATDGTYPQVSFGTELIGGGTEIKASENIMFNRINPRFNIISPGKETSVSSNIRTTTGTSISGSEVSFNLQNTVEPVIPNQENDLNSVRIVCSRSNELNQSAFDNVSGKRSFNSTVTLNTTNENLSPMILLDDSVVEFISDNINRPVTNYVTDSSTNSRDNDPHESVYVSNLISLAKPASSLKVILDAYRPDPADIRVLYSLVREDSVGVEQEFELFPGFNNLESTSEGSLKVVNSSLNDGRPDVRVPASEKDQYLEYEFTANDLGDFSGYQIKVVMSSTDQANYPIIRNFRTIALK